MMVSGVDRTCRRVEEDDEDDEEDNIDDNPLPRRRCNAVVVVTELANCCTLVILDAVGE